MLLNNFRDGNRKSPATDHLIPVRKESLVRSVVTREFFFPAGVLGFANCRHFRLARFCPEDGSESPFFTLRCVDPSLEFPLIHPSSISLDYRFHAGPEVLAALEASSAEELEPMLIVTVRDKIEDITVNLQGPLVLNPKSLRGLQLVVEDYPLRYPLVGPAPLQKFSDTDTSRK
jgi:flagellar assembly factor FliW